MSDLNAQTPPIPADHELLTDLTEPQRAAVTTTEGPVLVVAAAGSGKTRVITRRVAWLVREVGLAPWQICAITFTNKAAGEMRERAAELLTPRQAKAVSIGTFHALCVRLLREFAERAGFNPGFVIYDSADQKRAMKQALEAENINSKNFSPDSVLSAISNAKNQLIDAEDYAKQAGDFFQRIVARGYQAYQQILRNNDALDFDDLLMETAFLLRRDERVRSEMQDRFQYLLIDEYQDTNHAQFLIAHQLAAQHHNICAVGDPDQSIYGWRGADIRNILEFEEHYPQAKVIALGQNWRSTPQILQAADALIQNNRKRKHKPLFTDNAGGSKLRVVAAGDEEHEAQLVVDYLREHHDAGRPWSDMVVFYRMNALSRVMEDGLLRSSIPYIVARGTAFYQRKEVRDAVAYLRVLYNPGDEISLLRIINTPARGIGKTTIERLQAYAASQGVKPWEAIERAVNVSSLTPSAVRSIARFRQTIDQWTAKVDGDAEALTFEPGMRDVVEMVIRDSGLEAYYQKEDEEKLANLYELITAAQRFDEEYGEEDATLRQRLADYLESIALVSDIDRMEGGADSDGAVTLMTLHAAKGLEFNVVAIIGLEEGLLPHSRSMDSAEELEEERRLCFVGITRARRDIMLSHARYRTIRGQRERAIPSQFLREMPEAVIDVRDHASGWSTYAEDGAPGRAPARSASGGRPRSVGGLEVGCRVSHPQFGQGDVISISGAGPNARAKVDFDAVGPKTLILEYARLERMER